MDENPERRMFLDKLLNYMDEIRKPVTACPTISKQPLDLYRLYLYVKERGGFMEVCKVNFNIQIGSSKSNISSSHTQKFPFLSHILGDKKQDLERCRRPLRHWSQQQCSLHAKKALHKEHSAL